MACGVCELFFIDPYPRAIDRQYEVVTTHAYEEDFQLLETAKHYEYEVNFYRNYFELIRQEVCAGYVDPRRRLGVTCWKDSRCGPTSTGRELN